MAFDLERMTAALSARGLRITRQRRAVLAAIAAAPTSVSALEVYDAARERCPNLGLTTVYRTLDVLDDMGALRRVHGLDNCEGFVPASAGHGHTVICKGCGRVSEFTACDMHSVAEAAARETGFQITSHFLQFTGLCRECRHTASPHRLGGIS